MHGCCVLLVQLLRTNVRNATSFLRTFMREIGDRIREEREAAGLSQQALSDLCSVSLRSQQNYEKGERSPDANYLASLAAHGVDVLYILTGKSGGGSPRLDSAEHALLESYRRCSRDARVNLIQTAALLSAGLQTKAQTQQQTSNRSAASQDQVHIGDHGIQIGNGRVTIKRGK